MKKKFLAIISATLLATNAFALSIKKTELVMRDHRNLAASHTTFNQLKRDDSTKERLATKLQKTAFYKQTHEESELGEVFGAHGRNWISIGLATSAAEGTVDVENNLILHHQANANVLAGKIFFEPRQVAHGVRVDTVLYLDNFFKGLYFKNNIICKYVKNNLRVHIEDEQVGAITNENLRLKEILNGTTLTRISLSDQQDALLFAKLTGPLSRTGLENLESCIGIRLMKKGRFTGGLNFAWITPTGDRRTTGEFLWEPKLGSEHWGLGGGIEAKVKLWSDEDQSLRLSLEGNYRYLLKETEKRTLGLKGLLTTDYYNEHILSHYYLLGRLNHRGLFPAANVLTQEVDVTPGSKIDAIACFNYKHNNLCIDFGYNLFWKDSESVSLKHPWQNNVIGLASPTYDANEVKDPLFKAANLRSGTSWISSSNIDTHVAETPSILSHTIFGGIGYLLEVFDLPFMVGTGAAYEIGDGRSASDAFSLWLKTGVSF